MCVRATCRRSNVVPSLAIRSRHPRFAVLRSIDTRVFAGPLCSAGFYVENVLSELDQPGEWFYDPVSTQLYFWYVLLAFYGRFGLAAKRSLYPFVFVRIFAMRSSLRSLSFDLLVRSRSCGERL